MSSPTKTKDSYLAGIIEIDCLPFLGCVAKNLELKSFKPCIVSFFPDLYFDVN